MNRAINTPVRCPPVPAVGTIVPNPPLFKPMLGPDVNFVGALLKLAATVGPGNCVRLKILVNSKRTLSDIFSRMWNARLKLAFSTGMRMPRNQRIVL